MRGQVTAVALEGGLKCELSENGTFDTLHSRIRESRATSITWSIDQFLDLRLCRYGKIVVDANVNAAQDRISNVLRNLFLIRCMIRYTNADFLWPFWPLHQAGVRIGLALVWL